MAQLPMFKKGLFICPVTYEYLSIRFSLSYSMCTFPFNYLNSVDLQPSILYLPFDCLHRMFSEYNSGYLSNLVLNVKGICYCNFPDSLK